MNKHQRALKLAKKKQRVVWYGTVGNMGYTANGRQRWDKGRDIWKVYPYGKVELVEKNVYFFSPPKNSLFIEHPVYKRTNGKPVL